MRVLFLLLIILMGCAAPKKAIKAKPIDKQHNATGSGQVILTGEGK